MRIRAKVFVLLACCLAVLNLAIVAYAHPGKTDSNGGHRNSSTGEYHYHHGYGPHQHTDRDGDGIKDCPFDFDDRTRYSSSDSSSDSSHSNYDSFVSKIHEANAENQKESALPIEAVLYFAYALVAGAVCIPIGAILDGATNKKDPTYKKMNRIFTFLLWTAFPIALPLVIISGYLSELTRKKR